MGADALGIGAVALIVAALALIAVAVVGSVRASRPPPAPPPTVPSAPAPEPLPPPPPPAGPAAAERLQAASAWARCGAGEGGAVFVTPDRALSAVACVAPGEAQLRLADGRELLGRTLPGAPPGTSIVEVPGAGAPFLTLGAAAALPDGAPVRVGLEGGGIATVGEAVARGLTGARGRPALRVEEAAAPLQGPVVDGAGLLVGLVPVLPLDAERPGLAVPAEAFAAPLGTEASSEGWTSAVAAAAGEERSATEPLAISLRRTTLLAVRAAGDGAVELWVAARSARDPGAERVLLYPEPASSARCRADGAVRRWTEASAWAGGAPVPAPVEERLRRGVAAGVLPDLWIGTGDARLECDPAAVAPDATLVLEGGGASLAPVPFPREGLLAARAAVRAAAEAEERRAGEAEVERARAAEAEAEAEEGWRSAFREARARLDAARGRRVRLAEERDRARANLQGYVEEQLGPLVEEAAAAEKAAVEELEALDRKASQAGVPRAWRR